MMNLRNLVRCAATTAVLLLANCANQKPAATVDKDGNPIQIEAEGFHSIVLQHEIDHLNGTLFIDRNKALASLFIYPEHF